ncbi:cell division protein FtsK [Microbacterium lushaniae]|nr:cell division protein FtsK [Microbacterium lushaniae]
MSAASPPPLPHTADAAPLSLPPRPGAPARPPVPWLASAVPVVGALGFWALTGSVFALWFALLGPLIAVAGIADGARATRRARRAADREAAEALARVRADVDQRHDAEREALRTRHPDVAGHLARPDRIWRGGSAGEGRVVVGTGEVASATRVSASGSHPDDRRLAHAARTLSDAPVAVALAAGCVVVGPEVSARAVLRALLLQVALAQPPGDVEIAAIDPGEAAWIHALPHAARSGSRRIVWARAGVPPPDADVVVLCARPGDPLPPGRAVVITLTGPGSARVEAGADVHEVEVEALGQAQAAVIAAELTARYAAAGVAAAVEDRIVPLSALRAPEREPSRTALAVAVGVAGGAPYDVDLVRDGPHAVVVGMTGAGKSELLVTWVTALCARYCTRDVSFLLADFKGGTAFEPLAALPHVTGVITDLDTGSAGRAIDSLRAEVRHREGVLARAGERDIAGVDLPRLVVVVDEFAALRDAHPDLEPLFADLAARGRALGIHLVLGTQRAGGVIRDGLLANCALRISLRVADAHDSTAVVGTPDAAALPGDPAARGLALVRRGTDTRATRVRVALCGPEDIAAAARGAGPAPRATWLPELPPRVAVDDLRTTVPGIVLGLGDQPDRQRQDPVLLPPDGRGLLVVGGPGSGKTTALHTIAAQVPARVWVGTDPEHAWDVLSALALEPPPPGTAVFLDDVDAVGGRLPDEYGRAAADAIERLVRDAGALGIRVFATAQRLTGIAGRIAELFPRRLVLPTPSRAEHVAAGGQAAGFAPSAPPGRGVLDGLVLQVAVAPAIASSAPVPVVPLWQPPEGVSGFVTRRGVTEPLQRWERTGVRVRSVDAADDPTAAEPGGRVVLVGDADQWMTRPRLLERMRSGSTLVVDAACGRDLRLLTGERDLPPYARPQRGRAWEFVGGRPPRRVAVTPSADT